MRTSLSRAALVATAAYGAGIPTLRHGAQILLEPPNDGGTAVTTPPVAIDDAALRAAIDHIMQHRAAAEPPGQRATPQLNPDAGQDEPSTRGTHAGATMSARAVATLTDAGDVLTARGERAALARQVFRLFRAEVQQDGVTRAEVLREMAVAGYFGAETQQAAASGDARALNTLTDTEGVLVPDVVLNEVVREIPSYGVMRELVRVVPMTTRGKIKVPNLASGLVAFFVGQGQKIKARVPAFGSVELDPAKMGLIVPWTTEFEEDAAPIFLELIVQLVAEAFGLLEDRAILYGNGSALYGGITGVANAPGVRELVLGDGATTPDKITFDAALAAQLKISAPLRKNGTFVFHADAEIHLRQQKDTQGRPLVEDLQEGTIIRLLGGKPVRFVEAADAAPAPGGVVGFYGDWKKVLLAQYRAFTTKRLTEATITDVDDATEIQLGAQDMEAIRCTQRIGVLVAMPQAFCRIKLAAA